MPHLLDHMDIPPQDLYDGLEDGLWEQTFTLPVDGITFRVTELHGSFFDDLQAELGDAAFQQVIADAGIERYKGTYKGVRRLGLDYLVRGGYLFVIAIGESSPGRYQLAFQGAWRMS